MSAADIRDVLGVHGIETGPAAKKVKLTTTTTERRTDGMSRELYNLIGDNLPPVVTVKSKFKEKPKFRQRSAKWSKVSFLNNARADRLALSHWTRGATAAQTTSTNTTTDTVEPYRFEAFDKHPDVISYTDAEYTTYLDKPDWTREDTDLLIRYCNEYDLRFVVIQDRWAESKAAPRTMEQLKDRYYSIARSLLASRGQSTEGLSYDYQRECTRKKHLEELSKRTPEQIEEENQLILDLRRLEAYQKTLAQQKAELLRLLETPVETGSAEQYMSAAGYAALAQNMLNADKQKHKKRPSEAPLAPSSAAKQQMQQQKYRKLTPREERERGVSWHEKLSSGVYLRSQKTLTLKQAFATKVQAVMQELGLSNVLTMPTEKTVRKYDQMQHKINILLEAKRLVDKSTESAEAADD